MKVRIFEDVVYDFEDMVYDFEDMVYDFEKPELLPSRIRTPPAPVSGFVTVTTPVRIRTPPAPVSGFVTTPAPVSEIQQHTLIV